MFSGPFQTSNDDETFFPLSCLCSKPPCSFNSLFAFQPSHVQKLYVSNCKPHVFKPDLCGLKCPNHTKVLAGVLIIDYSGGGSVPGFTCNLLTDWCRIRKVSVFSADPHLVRTFRGVQHPELFKNQSGEERRSRGSSVMDQIKITALGGQRWKSGGGAEIKERAVVSYRGEMNSG